MKLMADNNEEPQVIIANKPFLPIPPRIFLILGGIFLISILGFLSFRFFFPKPAVELQPTQIAEEPKVTIPCPTDAVFCQNAKPIVKDGRFLAMGLTVDPDSPIYAVFDGKAVKRGVSFEDQDQEGFSRITLVDGQKQFKAVYSLKKTATLGNLFKKGDMMGIVSKDPIEFFGDYNLAFTLLDQNNQEIPYERIIFQ